MTCYQPESKKNNIKTVSKFSSMLRGIRILTVNHTRTRLRFTPR